MFYNRKWLFFIFMVLFSFAAAFGFARGALYGIEHGQWMYFLAFGLVFLISTLGSSLVFAFLITLVVKIWRVIKCKIQRIQNDKSLSKLFWYLWTILGYIFAVFAFIRFYR